MFFFRWGLFFGSNPVIQCLTLVSDHFSWTVFKIANFLNQAVETTGNMWKLLRSDISKNVRSQILKKRPWEKSVVASCLTCQILVKTRDAGSYTHTASPTRPHNSRSVFNHTYGMYGPNSDTRTTQKGSLTEIWPGQILSDRCQTIKYTFFFTKTQITKNAYCNFLGFLEKSESRYISSTQNWPHMLTTSSFREIWSQTRPVKHPNLTVFISIICSRMLTRLGPGDATTSPSGCYVVDCPEPGAASAKWGCWICSH